MLLLKVAVNLTTYLFKKELVMVEIVKYSMLTGAGLYILGYALDDEIPKALGAGIIAMCFIKMLSV